MSNISTPEQEDPGTVAGSFTNEDQESDSSIGSGSADQGIDAEDVDKESEFGDPTEDENSQPDNIDSQPSNSGPYKHPDHGLVEEGPGPDA